uniref:Reverse transcriptase domain-containing protein n=1 Tax=Plectus sambesii TaxID=2011161 RepID=A0A914XBV3_9BILA
MITKVKAAIKSLKNGKAPGVDQIMTEMLKAGGDVLVQRLHTLLGIIWTAEQVPEAWKKLIIIPILKKGDNRKCKNYCGISLLSIVGKVFTKIIQSRLQKLREQTSREEQAGFRPNRGCIDQIFALRQVIEEWIWCSKRLVVVFIDFKSAFDCIHWPSLWSALETKQVSPKVIQLLQALYDGSVSRVRVSNELSNEFPIRTGVRQRDVVLPLLFNVVIDAIMRVVFANRHSAQYNVNQFITDLMFADDSAVFANTDAEATDTLYNIAQIAQSYGLKINAEKTKALTTDGLPAHVHLNGVQIEQVREFKYLGSLVQEKKTASSVKVYSWIGQATAAFASLKWCVWKKLNISAKTKIHLFRSLVLPILLYGSEMWTLLKADASKLEQRRLRWFGHVCRMNDDRLPRRLLWCQRPPEWKIQRAAPKKTWLKCVEEDLRPQRLSAKGAKNIAADQQGWKNIVNEVQDPVAPTAAYWLRGRSPPNSQAPATEK